MDSNHRPPAYQADALTCWAISPNGGDNRDRTDDPLLAKQVLSQLSYTPIDYALGLPFKFKRFIQLHLTTLRLSEKSSLRSKNIIFASQTMSCFLRDSHFFGLRCSVAYPNLKN